MKVCWDRAGDLRRYSPLRSVHVAATGVDRPTTISRCTGRIPRLDWSRDGNITDDLRYRRPLRHAFTAGEVCKLDAALRDVTLQVGQSVRAILIELALNVIFHLSRKSLS